MALIRLQNVLSRGGVAVVPTDTLYGFSAAISSRNGYEKIIEIKGSEADRRFLYLACDIEMVSRYIANWGCTSRRMLEAIWPAAMTGIFPAGELSPRWLGRTAAFRVPLYPAVQMVISALGEPILSTSINESGGLPLNDVDAIESRFGGLVDLIVDGGELSGGLASTLVDFTGAAPTVLRAGSYGWTAVEKPSN